MSHDKEYSASGSELIVATDAALTALAWSEVGEDGEPLDALDAEFSQASRERMREELSGFIEANSADLHGLEYDQIGHDFILTRNRHGAGFWDRGLGERGERLTSATHPHGSISAYLADSGELETE